MEKRVSLLARFFASSCLLAAASAEALDSCSDILRHGVFNRTAMDTFEEVDFLNVRDHCSSDARSARGSAEVPVKGVPVKLDGAWAKDERSCDHNLLSLKTVNSDRSHYVAASRDIINAWKECMVSFQGPIFSPTQDEKRQYVTLHMLYRTPNPEPTAWKGKINIPRQLHFESCLCQTSERATCTRESDRNFRVSIPINEDARLECRRLTPDAFAIKGYFNVRVPELEIRNVLVPMIAMQSEPVPSSGTCHPNVAQSGTIEVPFLVQDISADYLSVRIERRNAAGRDPHTDVLDLLSGCTLSPTAATTRCVVERPGVFQLLGVPGQQHNNGLWMNLSGQPGVIGADEFQLIAQQGNDGCGSEAARKFAGYKLLVTRTHWQPASASP